MYFKNVSSPVGNLILFLACHLIAYRETFVLVLFQQMSNILKIITIHDIFTPP